jgi:beta-N-acetylhexosaminidase
MSASKVQPLGAVMVDIAGFTLTAQERERLCHPGVGGVILFSRNYESPAQLRSLTRDIAQLRSPALMIAVDHEGGRVQRFRHGFTVLPACRRIGALYDDAPEQALQMARAAGFVLAYELRQAGVDFSFAPVLDIDFGRSIVIGDRAFHRDPLAVAALASAQIEGLHAAGMAAVGKHFPGHGYVGADSHVEIPVDDRSLDAILAADLVPYPAAIAAGLDGVMPAHVIYAQVDSRPAGFSPVWIADVLRRELGFRGLVFSDDLSMEGASVAGDIVERAEAALEAGCDMVLVCNAPASAETLLSGLPPRILRQGLAARMVGRALPASVGEQQRCSMLYMASRRLLTRLP